MLSGSSTPPEGAGVGREETLNETTAAVHCIIKHDIAVALLTSSYLPRWVHRMAKLMNCLATSGWLAPNNCIEEGKKAVTHIKHHVVLHSTLKVIN